MKIAHSFSLSSLFCAIVFSGCTTALQLQHKTSILVIQQVSVVDVEAGKLTPPLDVAIRDKQIIFVGSAFKNPGNKNTTYIDGRGKYLMPGLWDMHVHVCWLTGNDSLIFPALLKNGITGIRDMGGDLGIMRIFKTRIQSGEMTGPEIYGAGPMIDGTPPVQADFSLPVDELTDINAVLDSLAAGDADFFKTYSVIKEEELQKIAAYCSRNNMTFAGHLSEYIDPEISIASGQQSIEHLNRLDEIWQTSKTRTDSIARLMIARKAFLCPTMITYQLKTRLSDSTVINPAYEPFIPGPLKKEWDLLWTKRKKSAEKKNDPERLKQVYGSQQQLVKHLDEMGVMMLAGSDFAGMPYVYPGAGLQEELLLLSEAGLSNAQVLQTATINPAIFMNRQQWFGSVAVGKYADLVLLEKNPLEEIRNIKLISKVIVKGKLLK